MWKKYRNKLSFPHFFHNVWKTLRKPVEKKSRQKLFIFFIDENNQSAYNRDDVLLLINQGKIIDKGGAYQ